MLSEQWSGYTNGLFEHKSGQYKKQIHKLAQQAAGISTVSTFLKNHMQRLGLTSNPFTVIPNVVTFQNEELKAPSKNHPIRIINISDLVDQTKNVSGFLFMYLTIQSKLLNVV